MTMRHDTTRTAELLNRAILRAGFAEGLLDEQREALSIPDEAIRMIDDMETRMGVDVTAVRAEFVRSLGAYAKSFSDDEWGSDDQIEAENAFGDLMEYVLCEESFDDWCSYAIKATTDERIDYGLAMAT